MAEGELIRSGAAIRLLGLSRWAWSKLVESGRVKPIPKLYRGAREFYRRSDVEALGKDVKRGE